MVSFPPLVNPEQPDPPRFEKVNPFSLIPEAKVEVAVEEETLRVETESPPRKVEVPIKPWE